MPTYEKEFTLTGCADCCGGVQTDCCPEPIPNSLTATLSAPSCAALHGTAIPLTYDGISGGFHIWSGTFSPGGSCGVLTFQFGIAEGVSCDSEFCIRDSMGNALWGTCTGSIGPSISCPFVSSVFTDPVFFCIAGIDCTGSLTAVVA